MQPKAFVHIGLAKTGTTSLQFRLASQRREIENYGFYFPRTGTFSKDSGHHCLAWSLTGSTKAQEFCQGFQPDLFSREIEEQAGDRTILVSSEELSSLSFNYMRVRTLLRLFPRHDVHVVAYVREQAEFFNSYYLEIVSDFTNPGTIERFVQDRLKEKRYDYGYWFNIWSELLGEKLRIRPYDRKALKNGDVVEDFMQTVGLRLPPVDDTSQFLRNLAWNNVQVAAVLELVQRVEAKCRGTAVSPETRRRLKQIVTALVSQREFSAGERYWGIPEAPLRVIRERYATANSAFFQAHGMPEFVYSSISEVSAVTALAFADLGKSAREGVERVWTEAVAPLLPKTAQLRRGVTI